jgi:hypothetical protein
VRGVLGWEAGRTGIPERCDFHPYEGFPMEKKVQIGQILKEFFFPNHKVYMIVPAGSQEYRRILFSFFYFLI